MLAVYVNYGKHRYLRGSNRTGCIDYCHTLSMQYATMPHNLIFIGIDFLLPNCAYNYSELEHTARPQT